jgi:hypothetical protein
MGCPCVQCDISTAAQFLTVKCEYVVHLDLIRLNLVERSQLLEAPGKSYGNVYAGKMEILVQMSISLF